jgi:hypothetical protein
MNYLYALTQHMWGDAYQARLTSRLSQPPSELAGRAQTDAVSAVLASRQEEGPEFLTKRNRAVAPAFGAEALLVAHVEQAALEVDVRPLQV